ncbi:MAG: hypothetical protein LBK95_07415 [Bifidobacteriaceae bacterium]|jgi:hypothetical protein|nr:hypothetical protein [Bifidobacteriaceae bacterium]
MPRIPHDHEPNGAHNESHAAHDAAFRGADADREFSAAEADPNAIDADRSGDDYDADGLQTYVDLEEEFGDGFHGRLPLNTPKDLRDVIDAGASHAAGKDRQASATLSRKFAAVFFISGLAVLLAGLLKGGVALFICAAVMVALLLVGGLLAWPESRAWAAAVKRLPFTRRRKRKQRGTDGASKGGTPPEGR